MLLGSERLLASSRLDGLKVGILANPASIDHNFTHIVDRLTASTSFKLGAIFGPQHGFRSDLQDNMIETPHIEDPRRNVPIFSLYSETREPTPEMLGLIDVLVIDIQDVGARIYTFIYTMANCLRAASRAGLPVIVCDRPNPIGGVKVEGPTLEPAYDSCRRLDNGHLLTTAARQPEHQLRPLLHPRAGLKRASSTDPAFKNRWCPLRPASDVTEIRPHLMDAAGDCHTALGPECHRTDFSFIVIVGTGTARRSVRQLSPAWSAPSHAVSAAAIAPAAREPGLLFASS